MDFDGCGSVGGAINRQSRVQPKFGLRMLLHARRKRKNFIPIHSLKSMASEMADTYFIAGIGW